MHTASNVSEIQQALLDLPHVKVTAGGSKTALSSDATLSLTPLAGVSEYQPSEYTFTARAATPLAEIESMLAEHRQYLPFDPPLVEAGATLGGTVAAGLSGPARFRYGGVRDFILGVQLVNGEGELVTGGGKVVKNAAGFDIPKLMVGSLGTLGIMTEMTFKVFPTPAATATLLARCADTETAVELLLRLGTLPADLLALEFEPPDTLAVRIGGLPEALGARLDRLREALSSAVETDQITADEEGAYWNSAREFRWLPTATTLVKLPLNPRQLTTCEALLERHAPGIERRYSVGGNVAWIAWPNTAQADQLRSIAAELDAQVLAVKGASLAGMLPARQPSPFAERLQNVFDPDRKFEPRAAGV